MKEWLIDVPVKTTIWIRPECQRRQFEVIKQARPSILFLQSDGGRNEKEWEAIRQNRKMFDEEIDWDCTVYKLYEDKNLGLYTMGKKMRDFMWEKVDRCICMEDDILPSVSFFRFCAELLEKYKDDLRISCICGMNHLGVSENVNSDYFFSREGSIWGTAIWKRTIEQFEDFSYGKDPYVLDVLKQRTRHDRRFWKALNEYSKNSIYQGHVAGSEFFINFSCYGHNQLQIIPKYNLTSNIGCTDDAEHAGSMRTLPKSMKRIFNMKTYEMEFPLKEAKYVMPDVEYEKKRNWIMAKNHPILRFWMQVQRTFLMMKYIGLQPVLKRIKVKFETKFNHELTEK